MDPWGKFPEIKQMNLRVIEPYFLSSIPNSGVSPPVFLLSWFRPWVWWPILQTTFCLDIWGQDHLLSFWQLLPACPLGNPLTFCSLLCFPSFLILYTFSNHIQPSPMAPDEWLRLQMDTDNLYYLQHLESTHTWPLEGEPNALGTPSVVHGPMALVSPGSLLELWNLRHHARPYQNRICILTTPLERSECLEH